ncbi:MAG TPA: RNA-directed DNA polymerase [Ignavibacteria bacterium]
MALEENLDKLHRDLIHHRYKPELSIKLYIPKKSGVLRPISLLNIRDQIVYLSLISVIAEKLVKKAYKNYSKTVFGHLYAGKTSKFFYKRWNEGYISFNNSINKAFKLGYEWTASFDLTAFYDSIDHKVLSHFLEKIGITKEFNKQLTEFLEVWTATTKDRIFHGHGIPQGPLSSGLLSEVMLQHFDNHKVLLKTKLKYFRYVDDIRLLGKTEKDLRKLLIELDLISKEIGLFPQSSKINIHKITNIDDELKSISLPPEPIDFRLALDQKEVSKRLYDLCPRNHIANETRFKYVLSHAKPNATLGKKLLKILDSHPHLFQSILRHFSKYPKLSKKITEDFLEIIKGEQPYEEVKALYLITILNKIHPDYSADYKNFCVKLHKNRRFILSPNLRSIIFVWLLHENYFKFKDIEKIYNSKEWWLICNSLDYIDIDRFGVPSFESLVNILLKSPSFEVAIKAAYLLVKHNLSVTSNIKDINESAQIILKKARFIRKTYVRKSMIGTKFKEITQNDLPDKNWIRLYGKHHLNCERLCTLLTGYYKTDPNAFVNELDVFNDYTCDSLFRLDTSLGSYTLGKIGSTLWSPTSRFATRYPKYFALCKKIHDLRLESDLSHPKVKSTGKPTRRLKFKEIQKLPNDIHEGLEEVLTKI